MEIVIAVFLGVWIGAGCFLSYRRLKKEFQQEDGKERNS